MNEVNTIESVKRDAKAIARATSVTHSQALDVLAVQAGYSHWGAYQTAIVEIEAEDRARLARTITPAQMIRGLITEIDHLSPFVERARHLIVSGATSTGKTTTLKALLGVVPTNVPIAVLDEHPEIVNPNPPEGFVVDADALRRFGCAGYEHARLRAVAAGVGLVAYGEVSTRNANDVVSAMRMRKGPTVVATIHASNPGHALEVFRERTGSISRPQHDDGIACIQMVRDPRGNRIISEITAL